MIEEMLRHANDGTLDHLTKAQLSEQAKLYATVAALLEIEAAQAAAAAA